MVKRRWWILLLILIVVGLGIAWRVSVARGHIVTYRTEAVRRGDVHVQVSATGTLEAVTTVQVGSQVSGTISALYADFNDKVHKGQMLAQLDPTFLKAAVAQARADLNKSDVAVKQALRDSARTFPLGEQGLASKADLDNAQTALDAARASSASFLAALDRAETNLQYATVASPIDGVVVSRDVDVGQTVAASLSAPTLFTIAQDLTKMQLEASVDEADIGQVAVGQPATFTVDAYPELSFHGEVHQIRLEPQTVQNVVTYTVVIYVSNPDEKLLPGMTANVTILVDDAKDVLSVPSMALRFRPAGATQRKSSTPSQQRVAPSGNRSVPGSAQGVVATAETGSAGEENGGQRARRPGAILYVLGPKQRLHPVRVHTGISDGTNTAVYSDSLREGDLVVLSSDSPGATAASQAVVNPFAPRFGGGAGGRR